MKRLSLKCIFLLIQFLGTASLTIAQRDWSWVFGDHASMHFPNGGAPVVDSLSTSKYFHEMGACISDSQGRLAVFANGDSISDGLGRRLVRTFGDESTTQGALILPGREAFQYTVLVLNFYCFHGGPCLSACDVYFHPETDSSSVVGPAYSMLYDVSPDRTEKLAAVKDANGLGWWVLMHNIDNNEFVKIHYRDGIIATQTQSIGLNHSLFGSRGGYEIGEMIFSPKGDKLLAVTETGIVDLFDFDRCTSMLSNWLALGSLTATVFGDNMYYGCSFSPDGTKIFVSEDVNPNGPRLFQYDLNASDILASKTMIYRCPIGTEIGQHQLGPDGKIYVSTPAYYDTLNSCNSYLSVINNPNATGLACNFTYSSLYLRGAKARANLPNLPNYDLGPLLAQTADAGPDRLICLGDSVQLGYPDTTNGWVEYSWSGTGLHNDTLAQTWATPTSTEWYELRAYDPDYGAACGFTYDSVLVTVADSPQIPLAFAGNDTIVCLGDTVELGVSGAGFTYHWTAIPANWIGTPDSSTTLVSGSGTYVLTVQNPAGIGACFTATDQVKVTEYANPMPVNPAGADTVICPGDTVALGVASASFVYEWVGSDLSDLHVAQPFAWPGASATYSLYVHDSAFAGSCAEVRDSVTIMVYDPSVLPVAPAGPDYLICNGDTIELGVASASFEYDWSGTIFSNAHVAQPFAWPSSSVRANVSMRDTSVAGACGMVLDTVQITVEQPFSHEAPEDVSFCIGECFEIGVTPVSGYQYAWTPVAGLFSPTASMSKALPGSSMAYTLTVVDPALQSVNCRERRFIVHAVADACGHQSFIAVNGDGIAETLDLGDHAGRVSLRVFDSAGRLVFGSDDYENDWSASRLAKGMYVYRVNVVGDCPWSFVGRIVVLR